VLRFTAGKKGTLTALDAMLRAGNRLGFEKLNYRDPMYCWTRSQTGKGTDVLSNPDLLLFYCNWWASPEVRIVLMG